MTAGEAIKKALLLIGAVDRFGEPSENEYSDGLVSLNQLLRRLGIDRLGIHTTATVTHTMTQGWRFETIGPTGFIVTTRPNSIVHGLITIGDIDYEMTEISRGEYLDICDKDTQGIPEFYYYEPTATNGTIYFYPTPATTYTLKLTLHQPLTEYTSITTTMTLPNEYISHIPWALGIDIAPEYGREAPQSVAMRAEETFRQLKRVHSSARTLNTDPFSPGGNRSFDVIAGV